MKDYLSEAIKSLCPNSEFSYSGNDYSTINWIVLEGKAPTQSEIDKEIAKIKISEAEAENSKVANRAAVLDRLGITAEEAALLLG